LFYEDLLAFYISERGGIFMAEIPEIIKETVEDYVRNINSEIPVKKALLFGSYAKGTFTQDSDIDIAIFSDFFKDMKRVDGIKYLLRKTIKYPHVDLQPVAFTYLDYLENDGFAAEVLKSGIEIKIN
jgi:predicted nucleotidyltransferase